LSGGREDTVDSRYFSATSAKPARQGTTETYRKETRVFERDDTRQRARTSDHEVDIEVDLKNRR